MSSPVYLTNLDWFSSCLPFWSLPLTKSQCTWELSPRQNHLWSSVSASERKSWGQLLLTWIFLPGVHPSLPPMLNVLLVSSALSSSTCQTDRLHPCKSFSMNSLQCSYSGHRRGDLQRDGVTKGQNCTCRNSSKCPWMMKNAFLLSSNKSKFRGGASQAGKGKVREIGSSSTGKVWPCSQGDLRRD